MSDGPFFVYVLYSRTLQRHYTGSTGNLRDRLQRHNAGECKATKAGVPWVLVYKEEHVSRSAASLREAYFKTGKGRDELARTMAQQHV